MSVSPYAPRYPNFSGDAGYSSTGQSAPGYSSVGQVDAANAAYQQWLGSPLGQAQDTAAESAAAYARQQADQLMANAKQELNIKVATLKQQGRNAEADIALRQGDQQISRDRLAQELKIHQDQFGLQQQQFGLDQQKYGLDRAKTYADYASTPDRTFMLGDLNSALGRVGQGLGVQPYGYDSQPVPKTMAGFDALSAPLGVNGQAPYSTSGSQASGMLGSGQMGASTDATGASTGGTGSTTDPRSTAIQSIMKASPASDELGLDANDVAALGAIQNIIKMKNPGALQRMRPGQQQAFMGGAARLGYVPSDVQSDLTRSGIGQGSATSY